MASVQPREWREYTSLAKLKGTRIFGILWLLSLATSCCESRPFGTDNGYDNEGGTDPICWDSKVRWNVTQPVPNTTRQMEDGFDVLNERFFDESEKVNATLRHSCYDGFNFSVTSNDENFDGHITTGLANSFRFDLQFTTSLVDEDVILAAPTNGSAWFRVILCDALRTGFCTPFIVEEDIVYDNGEVRDDLANVNAYGGEHEGTLMAVPSGLHMYTPFVRVDLNETDSGIYNASVDISFRVPLGEAGFYFFLGHAIVYYDLVNNTSPFLFRIDAAQSIEDKILEVAEAPEILTITPPFKITVGVVIGLFLVGELSALYAIIRHRKNPVMTLAQGPWLALLTVCTIVFTSCSFVYMPTRNVYCNLRGFLILVPVTVMEAILVGRTWRAYSTLSYALTIGNPARNNDRKKGFAEKVVMDFLDALSNCHTYFKGKAGEKQRHALRRTVTDADLLRVVSLLVVPQVILQAVGLAIYRRTLEIDLSETGQVGRVVCDREEMWHMFTGVGIIALMSVMGLIVAWVSRDLPSVFNEKTAIFNAAAINGAIAFIVLVLIFVFDTPTTPPNVTSFLWIFMVLGIALTTLLLIVRPKLVRLRSGEKIVISKLLQPRLSSPSESMFPGASAAAGLTVEAANGSSAFTPNGGAPSAPPEPDEGTSIQTPIVLNYDDPPPRRIETQMLSLKDVISEMIYNSLEGKHLRLGDWELLISLVSRLNRDLGRLEFAWSQDEEEQIHGDDANG